MLRGKKKARVLSFHIVRHFDSSGSVAPRKSTSTSYVDNAKTGISRRRRILEVKFRRRAEGFSARVSTGIREYGIRMMLPRAKAERRRIANDVGDGRNEGSEKVTWFDVEDRGTISTSGAITGPRSNE